MTKIHSALLICAFLFVAFYGCGCAAPAAGEIVGSRPGPVIGTEEIIREIRDAKGNVTHTTEVQPTRIVTETVEKSVGWLPGPWGPIAGGVLSLVVMGLGAATRKKIAGWKAEPPIVNPI